MVGLAVYDPLDPATIDNPYPHYAALREHDPVHSHDGLGCWVLTRYDDCLAVVHDQARFARDRRRVGMPLPESLASLQTLDPPEQLPLKRIYLKALRGLDVAEFRDGARQVVHEALTGSRDLTDLVPSLAHPLSLRVTCAILGVRRPETTAFAEDADAIVAGMDARRSEIEYQRGKEARERLNQLIDRWLAEPPGDGILSQVRGPDCHIPASHIRNTVRVVFLSGYMALSSCIGNLLAAILSRPEILSELRDPGLLRTGVDELLRYDSPVTGTTRFAVEYVTLRGRRIKRGDGVLTLYAAANRDPEQFARPDELILDRAPNNHFGYSWGTHACIGRAIAQGVLRELVATIAALPRPPRLVAEPVRRPTATLRGISSLPVTFR